MTFIIPVINMDVAQVWRRFNDKLEEPTSQRKMVLVIVCIALLLDNMLYMVIVPIIPDYLRYIGAWKTHMEPGGMVWDNSSALPGTESNATNYWKRTKPKLVYEGEDSAVGMLFASKAVIQLFINPFSGAIIDRIGYDVPMMIGLTIMFFSTALFACGQSYGVLFFARSLQGVGSAFADTGGLAMIADRFTEDEARQQAIGIAQAFISFGSLVAPPFGGLLYEFAGKEVPFIALSLVSLMDGFALLFIMRPAKEAMKEQGIERPKGTPIYRLFADKYIAVAAGTLVMANVSLAFLEPTITLWMENTMENINEWQMGLIWLPAFFPHVFGVYTTVKLCKKYPRYQWLLAATGLALEGISSFFLPFCTNYWLLMIPLSGICFGIAQVDTSLLPMLGFLVDTRYVSVYGSIYAIADISYSLAYAIGPIIAGGIVDNIGFTGLNMLICITNVGYVPALWMLRHVHDYDTFENEEQVVMSELPSAQYKTFAMNNGQAVSMEGIGEESKGIQNQANPPQRMNEDSQQGQTNLACQPQFPNEDGTRRETNPFRQESTPPQRPQPPASRGPQHSQQQKANQGPPRNPGGTTHKKSKKAGGREELVNRLSETLPEENENRSMGDTTELPSQPVPDLGQSLDRFLAGVKPVVGLAHFDRCTQIVQEFCKEGGVGQQLQESLIQFAKTKENWATHFWLDDMYLKCRLPLPVNSSPFFLLPKQHFHSSSEQHRFAAKIILFALEYKKKIDNDQIEPDLIPVGGGKKQALCMATYKNFFPAYRRPGEDIDEQVMSTQQTWEQPMYIVVACKNQLFSVQVTTEKGEIISHDILVDQLRHIYQTAKEKVLSAVPVGILTSENRTTWAKVRSRLLKKNVNGQSLQVLENCLMVLCLDDTAPDAPNYATIRKESTTLELTTMAGHVLHGGGSANRWYDKFLQAVVTKNGVVGFIVEHSASEGITVLRFCEELLEALKSGSESCNAAPQGANKNRFPPPVSLKWDIDDETMLVVQEAAKKLNKLYKDVDLFVHRFTRYGKDFIKSQRISPDAFIQVALQLTYYKVHRRLVSTYESASLRRFKAGRVDNIRAATEEVLSWVKAMCDDQQVAEETKVKLFEECIKKQTEILKYTVNGEGPDNHLVALKEIAIASGMVEPALFQNKCYHEFLNFRLSTSQLPTMSGVLVGYGPVVPDGYGCSYNPCPSHIDFCVSSFFSSKETSSDFFAHSLEGSLLHMSELCLKKQQLENQRNEITVGKKPMVPN